MSKRPRVDGRIADKKCAKVPHKPSAARTSDLPRAQAAGPPHRMSGPAHKWWDARTDRRDARTDSQDCRTVSRMSAQGAGRAHSQSGPTVLVVCHAHRFPDTRTGRLIEPGRNLTASSRNRTATWRNLTATSRNLTSCLRNLPVCGRSLIKCASRLPVRTSNADARRPPDPPHQSAGSAHRSAEVGTPFAGRGAR